MNRQPRYHLPLRPAPKPVAFRVFLTLRIFLAWALLAMLGGCASTAAGPAPVADHHSHIRSEIAGQALPRVQLARGKSRHELSRGKQTANDLIAQMDRAGIQQAAILSLAYMYAIPELRFEDEQEKVEQENDFVADQAARFPDRLVAFCGISPIREYALSEIRRCADLNTVGIKMHMANSGVDLNKQEDWEQLQAAFSKANNMGLDIIIHYRPRGPRYGRPEAERFLSELMPLASDITVQLAHMGGGGIIDAATMEAIDVFAGQIDDHPNLYFDLSAAWARDGDFSTSIGRSEGARNRARVARAIERIGTARILFGSDWDSLEIRDTLHPLWRGNGLKPEDQEAILQNRAPYLPDTTGRSRDASPQPGQPSDPSTDASGHNE